MYNALVKNLLSSGYKLIQLKHTVVCSRDTLGNLDHMRQAIFSPHSASAPGIPTPPHYRGFTITLSRTPLDEWSARRTDPYLIAYNTRKRRISILPAGFEPSIPASERPQTHSLDRAGHWDRRTRPAQRIILRILHFSTTHTDSNKPGAFLNGLRFTIRI
jgi:hypothetical protein